MTLVGRAYRCSACTAPDHNRQRCPHLHGPIAPPRATNSRSERAAMLAAERGLSLVAAAAIGGVTHQAVQQAWVRIYGDAPTPKVESWQRRRAELVAAATAGVSMRALAERLGLSPSGVRSMASRIGVSVHAEPARRRDWDSAIAAVESGASVAEAAADHDVSYGRLLARVRAAGVRSTANSRHNYGAGVRAAELVLSKTASVPEAARLYRVSPAAVTGALRRLARRRA